MRPRKVKEGEGALFMSGGDAMLVYATDRHQRHMNRACSFGLSDEVISLPL